MRKISVFILAFSLVLFAKGAVFTVSCDNIDVIIDFAGAHISVPGGWKPGLGLLDIEYIGKNFLLPPGKCAVGVRILDEVAETLDIGVPPAVVRTIPLNGTDNCNNQANLGEFEFSSPVELVRTNSAMGYSVASIRYYPVRYIGNGEYVFYKKVDFVFELEDYTVNKPVKMTFFGVNFREQFVRSICDNFENIALYPVISAMHIMDVNSSNYSIPPLPGDSPIDVVIVTDTSLIDAAHTYLDPTKYGFSARFIAVEDIYPVYDGIDNAEKIRKFLKDAYVNWGFFVLYLVGDYTHIPVKDLNAIGADGIMADNPSDLYYAVLDGEINTDGDYLFGESLEDDIIPDVFYSRLEVRTPGEIADFAAKLEEYKFHHPAEFFSNLLFEGASVQPTGTDYTGANKKNGIIENLSLDTIFNITKMYSDIDVTGGDVEVSAENFVDFLQSNPFWFINHFDHGNQVNISMGSRSGGGSLSLYDIVTLENPYYPLFYSFSCDVNRLDTDNIARRWTINPHGGGIGFYAHSNTAWTVQANMDDILWSIIAEGDALFTGQLLSVWISRLNYDPYCAQILGFCGDPLTPIPSRAPDPSISVSVAPEFLSPSDSAVYVHIFGDFGDSVMFALSDGARILDRGFAHSSEFSAHFRYTGKDTVFLVLYTFPVKMFAIPVIDGEGAVVLPLSAGVSEVSGDGDGVVEPGEMFRIEWALANTGTGEFNGYSRVYAPELSLVDSQFCSIPPGDTARLHSDVFSYSDSVRAVRRGHIIVSADARQDTFSATFSGINLAPIFVILRNLEGFYPEAGDFAFLGIILKNPSVGDARAAVFKLLSSGIDPYPDSVVVHSIGSPYDTIWFDFSLPGDFGGTAEFVLLSRGEGFEYCDTLQVEFPPVVDSLWVEPAGDHITIFWEPPSSAAVRYYVYRSESPEGYYSLLTPEPIASSVYTDYCAGEGDEFYYCVAVVDSLNNVGLPSEPVYGWLTFELADGFPVDLPLGVWPRAAPVFVDADGDGVCEIYVADIFGNLCAFHYDGTELVDSTPEPDPLIATGAGINHGFWASPAVGDIDCDGVPEIVLADRNIYDSKIYVIDPWGNPKPGFPLDIRTSVLRAVVLYDLDGDGYLEIIAAGESSKLLICRYDGTPYVGGDIVVDNMPERASGPTYSAPAVADLDGDGHPEIVCGGPTDSTGNGLIYMWNWDGTRRDGFPITMPGNVWGSPVVGNLDEDFSDLEFAVYVSDCGIYAFEPDGTVLPGFPVGNSVLGSDLGVPMRSPALADFDRDGICEIVFTSGEFVTVINHDGTLRAGFPLPFGNPHWSGPLVADIDNDGVPDILSVNDTKIWVFTSDGEVIKPGFPLSVGVGQSSPPAIFDIDGDGYAEIVAPALDSKLYIWRTNSRVDSAAYQWAQFRGNLMRTGTLGAPDTDYVVADPKPAHISMSVSPNPFNSACRIRLSRPAEVEIFAISGHRIAQLHGCDLLWRPQNLPAGIYLLRAKFPGGRTLERRVLYIK